MKVPVWATPPTNLSLSTNEIHIWRANLNLLPEEIKQLEQILSEDERSRANRFRFPHLKNRFIAARGNLRKILSFYLQIESEFIEFEYSSRGKPQLAANLNKIGLQFNLSHSQDLALYGFSINQKIGIDLEHLRAISDVEKLAQRFFSEREYKLITNSDLNLQQQVFLQFWTAKEAYLKATGEGLVDSLAEIEFLIKSDQSISLQSVHGNTKIAQNWLIENFIPDSDYIATVAVEQTLSNNNQPKICFWEAGKIMSTDKRR
ncbi:phosphopantetheine-protein transferase [Stanieria cyanosphaera PCC 7437]|uniref:Phosphopantetheine-protein transferase n=1 Tax=Stanieria cyanosphaera (strain ATCC 29371 / PCC 7437) TaxID=111780 RepID=K9Y044_STAC7|nr:4'-phosphopantetheinyl transferase superfamily protein [Stanieria cyanosphaera]AFZ37756.1 phosphopantetheine-protein transferase [Stanieria cyanosphaera PCC 7437]